MTNCLWFGSKSDWTKKPVAHVYWLIQSLHGDGVFKKKFMSFDIEEFLTYPSQKFIFLDFLSELCIEGRTDRRPF